jgi:cell division protein FtsX
MKRTTSIVRVVFSGLGRGWKSLWRDRSWLSSILAFAGVFLLVQTVFLVLLASDSAITALAERTELRLEINKDSTVQETQTLLQTLEEQPFISSVDLITKEQAYNIMSSDNSELTAFLDKFALENPFRDMVSLTLGSVHDYGKLVDVISAERFAAIIDPNFLNEVTDQEQYVGQIQSLSGATQLITWLFAIITAGTLIVLTMELIRRRALLRRDELLVERLVGASTFSIIIPFIVEACLLLWFACLLGTLLLVAILTFGPRFVEVEQLPIVTQVGQYLIPQIEVILPRFVLMLLAIIPCIAIFGAIVGLFKMLRTRSLSTL